MTYMETYVISTSFFLSGIEEASRWFSTTSLCSSCISSMSFSPQWVTRRRVHGGDAARHAIEVRVSG